MCPGFAGACSSMAFLRPVWTCMAKPWEVNHVDTLDLWKFGDYKHYTSLLHLLSTIRHPYAKKMTLMAVW